jgi:ubiquinone/menaquinone biosynthesis C-methylase UbiE
MATDNSEQIADWNGVMGRQWAARQREIDSSISPFGDAALKTAAPVPGEHVIDIGCGCGDTSIALAQQVGVAGSVLGVDISAPMLEVARTRAASLQLPHLEFREADASTASLPARNDLLYSRFGVMFFDQPVPALAHARQALRNGGRLVFVCWRSPRENPWTMAPLMAARKAMNVTRQPADRNLPGPFAFADEDRLRGILANAGFESIELQRFDALISLGATPRDAAEGAVRFGPTSRFVREVGTENMPVILAGIEDALTPLARADGSVRLDGATWIVSAFSPG